jgi:hypothetical protein
MYAEVAEPEVFDPAEELRLVKRQMEAYLRERAKMAWNAKVLALFFIKKYRITIIIIIIRKK